MAGETVITFIGNLTSDPEIRFLPSGVSVCNFTVANNPRVLDKASGEWKDGAATFLRCNLWRQAGENAVESLRRGARVIVVGRLKQRSFTDKDGTDRTVFELDVDEVAPSLKYATAKVTKVRAGRAADAPPVTDADDPWAGGQPTGELVGATAGVGGGADSPPF